MKENIYNKKFSFGIDLEIKLEEYRKIINKYGKYINSVYFSLPFGDEFHSRLKMRDEYGKKGAINKLFDILMLFKSEKIKLEAVINQYNIDTTSLKNALNELKEFIKVDAICCLNEYVDIILKYYDENIYLVSSYNNGPIHRENIKDISSKYNMVVLGKEFMREPKLIREVRERGFDIKLLVNGGCSFNCFNCRAGKNNCVKVFNSNLKKFSYNELYAMQSFFPWELRKIINLTENENLIQEIKISSRPSNYEYIEKCLDFYINGKDVREIVSEDFRNYYLFARQANLTPYFNQLQYEEIEKIKYELWE